jgi:hypothetical protein
MGTAATAIRASIAAAIAARRPYDRGGASAQQVARGDVEQPRGKRD